MLPALLTLTLGWLPLDGVTDCPRLADIELALAGMRGASDRSGSWVEVRQRDDGFSIALYDSRRNQVESGVVYAKGKSCSELAAEAADVVYYWERGRQLDPDVEGLQRRRGPTPRPELMEAAEVKRGFRVPAALLGGLAGIAFPYLLSLAFGGTEQGTTLLGFTIALGPPVIGLLAWAGHRMAKGRGNVGFAMLGAALGCALALTVMFAPQGRIGEITNPAFVVPAAILAAGTPVLLLELSDAREREELGLFATPIAGGGMVGISGRL